MTRLENQSHDVTSFELRVGEEREGKEGLVYAGGEEFFC